MPDTVAYMPVTVLSQQIEVAAADSVLSAPLTAYRIGGRFGPRTGGSGNHAGIDFVAPEGAPVHAAAKGVVSYAGWKPVYGYTVEVDHGDGFITRYAHLSTVEVTEGQSVERGEAVGAVGLSGATTFPHLHFEVHENGVPRDPEEFMEDDVSTPTDAAAQRRLERDRMNQLGRDVWNVQERAADLVREQRAMEADMNRLGEVGGGPGSGLGGRLFERKEAMQDEIADLEREIHRLADETQADHPEASNLFSEAATTIWEDKLKERVRYSRGLIGVQDREYTREFEAETTRVVEELQEELQRASDAI